MTLDVNGCGQLKKGEEVIRLCKVPSHWIGRQGISIYLNCMREVSVNGTAGIRYADGRLQN